MSIPAFPHFTKYPNLHTEYEPQPGMTLRDFFASQALMALAERWIQPHSKPLEEVCYEIADKMLKEREK